MKFHEGIHQFSDIFCKFIWLAFRCLSCQQAKFNLAVITFLMRRNVTLTRHIRRRAWMTLFRKRGAAFPVLHRVIFFIIGLATFIFSCSWPLFFILNRYVTAITNWIASCMIFPFSKHGLPQHRLFSLIISLSCDVDVKPIINLTFIHFLTDHIVKHHSGC